MPEVGTLVRFTKGPLGLVDPDDLDHFIPQTVSTGDEGVVSGPHPTIEEWYMITVGDHLCPCHLSQFEVVA